MPRTEKLLLILIGLVTIFAAIHLPFDGKVLSCHDVPNPCRGDIAFRGSPPEFFESYTPTKNPMPEWPD